MAKGALVIAHENAALGNPMLADGQIQGAVAQASDLSTDQVEIFQGDSDSVSDGSGTWGSRSTVAGGAALLSAARALRSKILTFGAEIIETAESDVVIVNGEHIDHFAVAIGLAPVGADFQVAELNRLVASRRRLGAT